MSTRSTKSSNKALVCKICGKTLKSRPARKQHEKDSHFLEPKVSPIFIQGCTGKRAFSSRESAIATIAHIVTKGQKRETYPTRHYECTNCKKWHLTSKQERKLK